MSSATVAAAQSSSGPVVQVWSAPGGKERGRRREGGPGTVVPMNPSHPPTTTSIGADTAHAGSVARRTRAVGSGDLEQTDRRLRAPVRPGDVITAEIEVVAAAHPTSSPAPSPGSESPGRDHAPAPASFHHTDRRETGTNWRTAP